MAKYESNASYSTVTVQSGDYVQNSGSGNLFVAPGSVTDDTNSLLLEPTEAILIKDATQISHRSISGKSSVTVIRGF